MSLERIGMIINRARDRERKDPFLDELPEGYDYYELKSNDKYLFINQQLVVKLCLYCDVYDSTSDFPAMLYVHFANGNKLSLSIQRSEERQLINDLIQLGAENNPVFSVTQGSFDWKKSPISRFYTDKIRKNYEDVDEGILTRLKSIIRLHEKMNFIDGGCGDGRLLKKVEEKIAPELKECHMLGFDFNSANLKKAEENYSGACHFINGDLLLVDDTIEKLKKEEKYINPNCCSCMLLSGSLTRCVMDDGFAALQVLKKLFYSDIEYIIGDGEQPPLLNDFIAKRVGYKKVKILENKKSGRFPFAYQKITPEEILKNKINKIDKKNMLDLSMCSNPEEVLSKIRASNKIKENLVIDISFCDLSPTLLEHLHEIVNQVPNIKLICWHWDLATTRSIANHFANLVPLEIKRVDKDGYLMAPRNAFSSHFKKSWFPDAKSTFFQKNEENLSQLEYFMLRCPREITSQIVIAYLAQTLGKAGGSKSNLNLYFDESLKRINLKNAEIHELPENKIFEAQQQFITELEQEIKSGNLIPHLFDLVNIYKNGIIKWSLDPKLDPYTARYMVPDPFNSSNQEKLSKLFDDLIIDHPNIFNIKVIEKIKSWVKTNNAKDMDLIRFHRNIEFKLADSKRNRFRDR